MLNQQSRNFSISHKDHGIGNRNMSEESWHRDKGSVEEIVENLTQKRTGFFCEIVVRDGAIYTMSTEWSITEFAFVGCCGYRPSIYFVGYKTPSNQELVERMILCFIHHSNVNIENYLA